VILSHKRRIKDELIVSDTWSPQRLAAASPTDTGDQRGLMVSLDVIGQLLAAYGDVAGALQARLSPAKVPLASRVRSHSTGTRRALAASLSV
jgi:hypothetical protein